MIFSVKILLEISNFTINEEKYLSAKKIGFILRVFPVLKLFSGLSRRIRIRLIGAPD